VEKFDIFAKQYYPNNSCIIGYEEASAYTLNNESISTILSTF